MPRCDHDWGSGPNSGTEQCSNCGAIRAKNYLALARVPPASAGG
ncbi:DUF6255 family natural product biosynthesis protein [Nocardiopsis ganjiahuensis]